MTPTADQVLGCLLAGALGDALGVPYEGKPCPQAVEWPRELRVSDDTQLTLATCEAMVASQGRVDPAAIAESMTRWFEASRLTGLGASTYKALSELAVGGHWAVVGRKGDMAAGSGAAMRIAPLAFVLDPTDFDDRTVIRDVCRITHHSDEAYVGALAVTLAIRLAWTGVWAGGTSLLDDLIPHLPDSRVRERLVEICSEGRDLALQDVARRWGASGYVVESVPLALVGAAQVQLTGLQGTLESLVRCGGDTDTVASMAGQVMGALLGAKQLPEELVARLEAVEPIRDSAFRLARAIQ